MDKVGKNRTTVYLSEEAEEALEQLREKTPGGFNLSEETSHMLLEKLEDLKEDFPGQFE